MSTADKSNEITAIPELLKALDLAGTTVTIDAIGTQHEIVRAIIDAQADYVLAVKEPVWPRAGSRKKVSLKNIRNLAAWDCTLRDSVLGLA